MPQGGGTADGIGADAEIKLLFAMASPKLETMMMSCQQQKKEAKIVDDAPSFSFFRTALRPGLTALRI